ncbi:hypothetical protein Tco_1321211 [Tanacetum coccineum]
MSVHNSDNGNYYTEDPVTLISKLDMSDPLHLHHNDSTALTVVSIKLKGTENYQELFLGQIFSKWAKDVWEELKETYDKVDGSIMFGLHHQIHTLKQNGSLIAEFYHKLNALWKHIWMLCFILSREVLPDVRSAYATISSEESHRVASGSVAGWGSTLVCENYGFNGHSIERCFQIIGYPTDFGKKKARHNFKGKNVSNNNSVGLVHLLGLQMNKWLLLSLSSKTIKIRKNV